MINRDAGRRLPILFIHGASDNASAWMTTIWRFQSNGYDAADLFAIDFTDPVNPRQDTEPEPGRSTSHDQLAQLTVMIDAIGEETGCPEIVLVSHSRGGNAVRNYLHAMGGAEHCKTAVLAAAPCHGIYRSTVDVENEYNNLGKFLQRLNADGETVPGVRYLTLRSDARDMYYQPNGKLLGMPGPTYVDHDSPALSGAMNIVLPGLDHRECAFHPNAFRSIYHFITGSEPSQADIVEERKPVLGGKITGYHSGAPSNRPLADVVLEIFEVAPDTAERRGPACYRIITDRRGTWGPFHADPGGRYEFVITAEGHLVTHIYRPPFPRSSSLVHFRPMPLDRGTTLEGTSLVITRAYGLLAGGRDRVLVNGGIPSGLRPGVPSVSALRSTLDVEASTPISVICNDEELILRAWPASSNHVVIAEFQR